MTNLIRLHEGDSIDVLAATPDGTYTAVVTDPPYGLSEPPPAEEVLAQWLLSGDFTRTKRGRSKAPPPGLSEIAARFASTAGPGGFLGNHWDSFVPGPRLWREVYRTCRPGAVALVFAGTRTVGWMSVALMLAGFEIIDMIGWVTAQGMAKSGTVDKRIDRRRDDRDEVLRSTAWIRERCAALGLTPRDLDIACGTNGMGSHWTSAKSQPYVPTREQWQKLEPLLGPMPPEMEAQRLIIDAREPGEDWHKRQVIGVHRNPASKDRSDNACPVGPETREPVTLSMPATDASAEWAGWSTQLAPAIEPIIVARRPCEGTAVENVLRHGCGAMNVAACCLDAPGALGGLWPKNVMLDELAADLLDRQIGERKSGARRGGARSGMGYGGADGDGGPAIEASAGAPSRYFWVGPCATEDDLALPFFYVPKVRFSGRIAGLPEGLVSRHPTMKPEALMRVLCRLVGHPKGRILDPFAGSGSTLRAARAEGLPCDGIEREPDFARLARFRGEVATLRDFEGLAPLRLPTDPRSAADELER